MKLKAILTDNKVQIALTTGETYFVGGNELNVEYQATFIHIPVLKVNVHYYSSFYFLEGNGFNAENDDDDSDDSDVELFEDGPEGYAFFDTDTKECVYDMTGSALEVCISDFLHEVKGENWSMGEIEDLDCEVIEDITIFNNYILDGKI